MKDSIIGHLILKDWRINRLVISLALGFGFGALVLSQAEAKTARAVGPIWFFVVMCILSSMLPGLSIVNERKKQTLAFIMSLPVTAVQYSIAKVVSTWTMFLIPWVTLMISALLLIENRHVIPHGVIPMLLILSGLPLIGFCLMSAAALVGESEGALIGASLVCNSSYWFVWYMLAQIPGLTANWTGPVAVWTPAALRVLSAEVGSIIVILGLMLLLQSRKRDFI